MKDERDGIPIIGKIGMATCVTSQEKMPCGYSLHHNIAHLHGSQDQN
jgi:hypothetical protein